MPSRPRKRSSGRRVSNERTKADAGRAVKINRSARLGRRGSGNGTGGRFSAQRERPGRWLARATARKASDRPGVGQAHSTCEAANHGRGKGPDFWCACVEDDGFGRLAMSLATPEKIRSLQRKLYIKAKQEQD